jgi:ribosomal protein S18 acetylase RimI-like enzyme
VGLTGPGRNPVLTPRGRKLSPVQLSASSSDPGHRVRPATEGDHTFLFDLHIATMRELIEQTWGWDEPWQRENFTHRLQSCRVGIIEVAGRRVGAVWVEDGQDSLFLADLQVLPEFQRQGIGTAVVRELITEVGEKHIPIELAVLTINADARRLYERLGFKVVGEEEPLIYMRLES